MPSEVSEREVEAARAELRAAIKSHTDWSWFLVPLESRYDRIVAAMERLIDAKAAAKVREGK